MADISKIKLPNEAEPRLVKDTEARNIANSKAADAVFIPANPSAVPPVEAKRGLVPPPPSTPGTAKFLREDCTWAEPAGSGGTSDYDDLLDKPQINSVTLEGNKTAAQLSLQKSIKVDVSGTVTAIADANNDTEFVAGSNVTITGNTSDGTITIEATDTTYENKTAASGGTDVSLVTTGDKYKWDNKQSSIKVGSSAVADANHVTTFAEGANVNITAENGTITIAATDTTYSTFDATHAGLAPAGGTTAGFLKNNGTWATPDNTTYTVETGTVNGKIKITPSNDTAYEVPVYGLNNAAYKDVDSSITASSTSTKLPTSQAVATFVEGKGYTTNTGTVTQIGATGGLKTNKTNNADITDSGTLELNLKDTAYSTAVGNKKTTTQIYPVVLDSVGYPCVGVPWTDTTYTQAANSAISVDNTNHTIDVAVGAVGTKGVVELSTSIPATGAVDAKVATEKAVADSISNKAIGANSSTTAAIATFAGTDGKTLADSAVTIAKNATGVTDDDTKVPTSKAVKTYVDATATGISRYIGTITAASQLSTTAKKGDFYIVSTAWSGVHAGDEIIAEKDNPAKTIDGTNWTLLHNEADTNTTYTFAEGTTNGKFTVTPSDTGTAQSVAVHGLAASAYKGVDTTPTASSSNLVESGGVASALGNKQDTLTFDGTYNASTNKAATVSTVTNAINALDVTGTNSFGAGKTISAWSETDGKVSITSQNISITGSQISDIDTTMPSTAVDTKVPSTKLVKTQLSGKQDTLTFDGTYNASTNKAATVSTVTNAINALDVSEVTVGATKTINKISQADGKISVSTTDIQSASTSQKGLVQLNDAIDNTSTAQAATANAVKKVNDKVTTCETNILSVQDTTEELVDESAKNKFNPDKATTIPDRLVTDGNGYAFKSVSSDTRTSIAFVLNAYNNNTYVRQLASADITSTGLFSCTFVKASDFNFLRFGHSGGTLDLQVTFDASDLEDGETYTLSFNVTATDPSVLMAWNSTMICTKAKWDVSHNFEPYALPNTDLTRMMTPFFTVPINHNMIYRGQNLGETFTDAQHTALSSGDFTDLYLGDYWTKTVTIPAGTYIGGDSEEVTIPEQTSITLKAVIADFDTFYGGYDSSYAIINAHHAAIIVTGFSYVVWNKTNSTAGGYVASLIHKWLVGSALPQIETWFGSAKVLSHQKLLTNAITGDAASGWAWSSQKISLLSENQMYGSKVWGGSKATNGGYEPGEAFKHLNVFNHIDASLLFGNKNIWLRDIASAERVARLIRNGHADSDVVSDTWIVPAALILLS